MRGCGPVEAAIELVKLGFLVLPYRTEDWVLCRRLMDDGREVLMPLAAPIGTGQRPRNPRGLRELRERAPQIPLIVDAGIELPSHACQVMEWGFDGVLINTAVSRALDPVRMASAFAAAINGGRSAFLAVSVVKTPSPSQINSCGMSSKRVSIDCSGLSFGGCGTTGLSSHSRQARPGNLVASRRLPPVLEMAIPPSPNRTAEGPRKKSDT